MYFQKKLDAINTRKAADFILSCQNFDGGFGSKPGSESHAGLIYCAVGTLSILSKTRHQILMIKIELLIEFLNSGS